MISSCSSTDNSLEYLLKQSRISPDKSQFSLLLSFIYCSRSISSELSFSFISETSISFIIFSSSRRLGCGVSLKFRYNTVKKKLKAKVTERKELNVQKDKTSILNPIQHIKLNQQLTTVTEEIEELKSRKEQLIFQAQCSTDKDMTNLSKKYDQMNNNLDILDSQDISLQKQLEKDAAAFREEKFRPEPEQYTELLDTRIQIRPDFRDKLIEQLKGTFGKYYDYHRRDIAANEVDYLNVEDPDVFSHRAWELKYQREQEIRRNQPARTKKKSYDIEL